MRTLGRLIGCAALLAAVCGGCQSQTAKPAALAPPPPGVRPKMLDDTSDVRVEHDWRRIVESRLPLYGHRNWIVIADSAYPAQSRGGIETVVTGEDQITVVREVLTALSNAKHVRPIVYTDAELKYVPEQEAPGVTGYREQLQGLLGSEHASQGIPHAEAIKKLDEAGQTFRVLILKTNLTVPYSSVFVELDCAYWTPEAEQRLRQAMK